MKECSCWKDVSTLLLRLLLGMLFLVAGLRKFGDLAAFRGYIHKEFDPTFLAGPLLVVFSYALPFVEVAVGALLVLGLFTRPALVLTALTLIALFFGKLLVADRQTTAFIAVYFLITVYALRSADNNQYALDSLMCGCCCRDEKSSPTTGA